jgi:phytanoyl-CoA hydroxylase
MVVETLTAAEQHREQYREQGYLVVPRLLDAAELTTLRAALAELLEESRGLTESTPKFLLARNDDGSTSVRRIVNPIEHHPAFHELVFNRTIVDLVEELIGPDIQLQHTKLNLKPPSRQGRFEWHQDYPFFPHTNFDLLAVMVYLDDSTEENGCLSIIPGSHRGGPRRHLFARDGAFSSRLADESVVQDRASWLSVPVPAGGISLHHCNMLHSSAANTTAMPRSAVVIQYRAADNAQIAGNMGQYGNGLQIRGEYHYRARMVQGVFDLPGVIHDPLQRDG